MLNDSPKMVYCSTTLNAACEIGSDMDFAKELFNQPLPKRYEWLENKVLDWLYNSKASVADMNEVMNFVRGLSAYEAI